MFKRKYNISLLTSKWVPIKRNVNLTLIPRSGELLFLDGQYYEIINVIHMINKKQEIFLVIKELENINPLIVK